MNKLIALSTIVLLSACSTTYEDKQLKVMQQTELAQMQKHGFCEGDRLKSYIETRLYYMWTCNDGRNFMLPKDGD